MTATRTLILATAAALLTASLGACSRSEPEAPAIENQPMEAAETPSPLSTATPEESAPVPEATAAPTDINTSAEAPPPPEATAAPDEQMMDDASATGMTARSSRGEHPSDEPTPGPENR